MKNNFDKLHNRIGTYCTQWDYIEDRFNRKDLLPFSISDTDFRIPKEITERLKSLVEHQIYGYTRWNHDDYKKSITGYYRRHFNARINNDWVVHSPSVMYSVSLLIRLLSNENDKVLTFNPMYDSFFSVIEDNNRKLVKCELNKDDNFTIDFNNLRAKIKGCRILLLCSPHNPSGRMWTKIEMDQIIQICKENNVKVLSDEIHQDINLSQRKFISLLEYYDVYEELYTASSCSKTLNTPGLISSYAFIPNDKIRDQFLVQTRRKDFLNSASIMGMHATMVGYNDCDEYIKELVEYIKENMKIIKKFIDENIREIKFTIPDSTYLAWFDCRELPFNSEEIQDALVNIGKVAIMKGENYGSEKYLRMNVGCSKEKLVEGLKRLKIAIDYLYKR